MWVSVNKDRTSDPLMDYVFIETENNGPNRFFIRKGESAAFIVKIKLPDELPENLSPGRHNLYIGLNEEISQNNAGGFAVSTNVYSLIVVNVPYPGFYTDVNFDAHTVDYNEQPKFDLSVINRGTNTVNLLEANVEIFSEKESIRKLETKFLNNIAPLQNPTINWVLEPKSIYPGDYKATANVKYHGEEKKIDTKFRIGSEDIKITNTTQLLESGGVQKYEIHLESGWNNVLRNIYADIKILDEGVVVEKAKTPFLDSLAPWDIGQLEGFVDTTELVPKNYDAEITLYFGQKSKKITTELKIIQGRNIEKTGIISANNLITFAVFSVAILIILISINIYLIVKRKK